MSPIFRHELRLRGTIRAQARGVEKTPVRASIEYRDDEGQPALLPLRWNRSELSLRPHLDTEVVVVGFVGTDGRGYPVLYIHECGSAMDRETTCRSGLPPLGSAHERGVGSSF